MHTIHLNLIKKIQLHYPPCLRSFLVFYTFQRSPLRRSVSEKEESTLKVSFDRRWLCAFDKFTHLPCWSLFCLARYFLAGWEKGNQMFQWSAILGMREFKSFFYVNPITKANANEWESGTVCELCEHSAAVNFSFPFKRRKRWNRWTCKMFIEWKNNFDLWCERK